MIIGIAGCEHGMGVTHLCITLANYTASKHGFRTACLEMNDSAAFSQLSEEEAHSFLRPAISARRYFTIHNVDYYPSVKKNEVPELLNRGYQYYMLDFGVLNKFVLDEFLRCDRKFLVGSAAPWKQNCYFEVFQTYPELKNLEFFSCLVQFGEKTDSLKLSKRLSLSIWQFHFIPFLKNPFHIAKEQFPFFDELL